MDGQTTTDRVCIALLAGDIEVAVAALGAARCGQSLPAEFRSPLAMAQRDLNEVASALTSGMSPQLDQHQIDRLDRARREYSSASPPNDFAELGGTVDSVGLLQLARALIRRAARTVQALAGPDQPFELVGCYLDQLDRLLVVFAYETEVQDEATLLAMTSLGMCGGTAPEADSPNRTH